MSIISVIFTIIGLLAFSASLACCFVDTDDDTSFVGAWIWLNLFGISYFIGLSAIFVVLFGGGNG